MRQLVCQDDLDLVVAIVGEQRVGKQHAPRRTEADQDGVRLRGSRVRPPFVDIHVGHAGSADQGFQAPAKRRRRQGPQMASARQRERGCKAGERKRQTGERQAHRQPPPAGPPAYGGVQEHYPRRPDQQIQQRGLCELPQPAGQTLARPAEAPLHDVLSVPLPGRNGHRAGKGQDERVAGGHKQKMNRLGRRNALCQDG